MFKGQALNQANKATISKLSKIETKRPNLDMVWWKEEYKRSQRKQFFIYKNEMEQSV